MKAAAKARRVGQLKLFEATIIAPTWDRMPREIQEQTLRLVARLLCEHRANATADESASGVRHE